MQIVFVNVSFSFRFNAWIIHDVIYTYVDFRWRIKNVWTKWSSVCLYFEFPWKKKKDYSHTKYQNHLINSYPVAVIIFLNNLLIRVIKQFVSYTLSVGMKFQNYGKFCIISSSKNFLYLMSSSSLMRIKIPFLRFQMNWLFASKNNSLLQRKITSVEKIKSLFCFVQNHIY